jgi:hypothetical protein
MAIRKIWFYVLVSKNTESERSMKNVGMSFGIDLNLSPLQVTLNPNFREFQTMEMNHFSAVPLDVTLLILTYLDWEDLPSIKTVSKAWNKCSKDSRLQEEFKKSSSN